MFCKNWWSNNIRCWKFRYSKANEQFDKKARSLWFYSKDAATKFNADIANTNSFKSYKYKAKLLGIRVA